jgi:hypothetical protein
MDLASGHVAALNKLKKEHLRLKVDGSAGTAGLRGTSAYKHISEDSVCFVVDKKLQFPGVQLSFPSYKITDSVLETVCFCLQACLIWGPLE